MTDRSMAVGWMDRLKNNVALAHLYHEILPSGLPYFFEYKTGLFHSKTKI